MSTKDNNFIEELRRIFVSIDVFDLTNKSISDRISPIEKIVYGFISLIAVAVLTAIISLVIRK